MNNETDDLAACGWAQGWEDGSANKPYHPRLGSGWQMVVPISSWTFLSSYKKGFEEGQKRYLELKQAKDRPDPMHEQTQESKSDRLPSEFER